MSKKEKEKNARSRRLFFKLPCYVFVFPSTDVRFCLKYSPVDVSMLSFLFGSYPLFPDLYVFDIYIFLFHSCKVYTYVRGKSLAHGAIYIVTVVWAPASFSLDS